jgi:hypothetical protein
MQTVRSEAPEGKRPLGRLWRRGDIKMDLEETGWKGKARIHLTYDRDQWRALLTTGSIKGWEGHERLTG